MASVGQDIYSSRTPLELVSDVESPNPRYRLRDLLSSDKNGEDKDRVRVEHYIHDKSFKERVKFYFITNQRYSVRWHLFRFIIKVLTCCLYVARSVMDTEPHMAGCSGCPVDRRNRTKWCCPDYNSTEDRSGDYFTWALLFVHRSFTIWAIQTALAIYGLLDALLISFLNYKKGNIIVFINMRLAIEIMITTPFFISIFWTDLRNIWVPVFLNCWLAKSMLEIMFNDLHRLVLRQQSAVSQKVLIVFGTVFCIIFTSVCGIHHLERAQKEWNFFECIWFVVVTFSTVGYGDHTPPDWPAQTFVMFMIITALVLLPIELEQLAFLLVSRQKEGGAYSRMLAGSDRHVVLCSTTLRCTTLIDFLNEFYSNATVQDVHVVLLCPSELDSNLRILLQVPVWAQRVTYLKGSALIDEDLVRARVEDARGCFVLADRSSPDRESADQHTILRTWAIQDFAPATPLYVQILKPENKFHVSFAEFVVCEDEIKHALLASNCVCPGISTFVTLLLHTLHEQRGSDTEKWHEMYGKCAGNEIYDIRLGDSKIFRPYAYKSFTHAAFHAHKRYGVTLIAVRKKDKGAGIILNPGPAHIMNYDDRCFYIAISSEEDTSIKEIKEPKGNSSLRSVKLGINYKNSSVLTASSVALELRGEESTVETVRMTYLDDFAANGSTQANGGRNEEHSGSSWEKPQSEQKKGVMFDVGPPDSRRSFDSVFVPDESDMEDDSEAGTGMDLADLTATVIPSYVVGVPPVTPYIGRTPIRCHLLTRQKEHCCLRLKSDCEHRDLNDSAHMHQRQHGAIIVASPVAEAGLYNFILPLRAFNRAKCTLKPIVLLLEEEPSLDFLEAVCCFPMLYYMLGNINSLDDLLFAGLLHADTIVVVGQYSGLRGNNAVSHDEEHLADASTIVGVQTIYRLFPNASIIVELQHATNMRFMKFNADPVLDFSIDSMASLRESIKLGHKRRKDGKTYASRSVKKSHKDQRRIKEKNKKDHLNYMFREPFASGSVFSMSMIDTLIYQTFVKDYMITLISLLLGCEQAPGSGYLCALKITADHAWIETYGRLFQRLCSTTCEIPIGIYRSEHNADRTSPSAIKCDSTDGSSTRKGRKEIRDIHHILENRIQNLRLSGTPDIKKRQGLFFVIVNPPPEFELQEGDIVYLIRPFNISEPESSENEARCASSCSEAQTTNL